MSGPNAEELARRGRLLISCPDRHGIVAAVSQFLFEHGANITPSDQHSTALEGSVFFMRVEFALSNLPERSAELQRAFAPIADRFCMEWHLSHANRRERLAIFVSKEEHCLLELLWQRQAGDLRAEIAMVVSNHPDLENIAASWGIPFHYVPVPGVDKWAAEQEQLQLLAGHADVIVLARYMQILLLDSSMLGPDGLSTFTTASFPPLSGHGRTIKRIGMALNSLGPRHITSPRS